jgi:hypothetical protein
VIIEGQQRVGLSLPDKVIGHSFFSYRSFIINSLDTVYLVTLGQFFKDDRIKTDPIQPLTRVVKMVGLAITGTDDPHVSF